jgi:hypothetical protein
MGTSAAVVFACLFMADIEDKWIKKFQEKLFIFKRFIDDGFGVFRGSVEETRTALIEYNELHPNIKIEFATSSSFAIFLDLKIYKSIDNQEKLHVACFQKEMNKYLYLPFTSYHDQRLKSNFIRGELIRYLRNSSEEPNFISMKKQFFSRLRARGYPSEFLFPIFLSINFSDRPLFLNQISSHSRQKLEENSTFLIVEKNPLTTSLNLASFFDNHWFTSSISDNDHSDGAKFLRNLNPPTILTKYPANIRQLLIRSEFNGFAPQNSKTLSQFFNAPKQQNNPLEEHRVKRFKPPPVAKRFLETNIANPFPKAKFHKPPNQDSQAPNPLSPPPEPQAL